MAFPYNERKDKIWYKDGPCLKPANMPGKIWQRGTTTFFPVAIFHYGGLFVIVRMTALPVLADFTQAFSLL